MEGPHAGPSSYPADVAAPIRIGTCSWADEALSKHWYPEGTPPKERLAYYAERFSTVEVDSTYYRVPTDSMVRGWAERTPDDFVMHIKAFGLMTRHPVKLEQLPPDHRLRHHLDDLGPPQYDDIEPTGHVLIAVQQVGPERELPVRTRR